MLGFDITKSVSLMTVITPITYHIKITVSLLAIFYHVAN